MKRCQIGVPKRNRSQKDRCFSWFQTCPYLHYNGCSWTFLSPPVAMPSSRPNLTLDEQSFQGLLSAAFIIQEHNDRQKQARPAQTESEGERVGQHGGALEATDALPSESSGPGEMRPGERLQRNWASMWLMSQERGLWPERSAEIREAPARDAPALPAKRSPLAPASDFAASNFLALGVEKKSAIETITQEETDTLHDPVRGRPVLTKPAAESDWITEADDAAYFAPEEFPSNASDDSLPIAGSSEEATDASSDTAAPISFLQRLAGLHVKLRFRRADVYLGTAIFVAALALLWPVAGSPQRAALSPWERTLVTLGIAEAPAPVIHLQGDPGIEVWVDPHTALYYCPGEEQYGKTPDGRLSSQREAQMDRFEPAGRSACE